MDRFRSMGCEIVVGGAAPSELRAIRELFDQRDGRFSRFRVSSELARVNASSAPTMLVSAAFAEAVAAALDAVRETGGRVDPTLLPALENAGYDADFAMLVDDPRSVGPAVPGRAGAVRLAGRLLMRPPGVRLDLAGVVKAMAVDDALRLLGGSGFVSAGGTSPLSAASTSPSPTAAPCGWSAVGWRRAAPRLAAGAAAARRRGGAEQHHLIAPRTGRPAVTPWQQMTVCAGSCLGADVAAKAAFLRGEEGPSWLERHGLAGRFLTAEGEVIATAGWPREELACT